MNDKTGLGYKVSDEEIDRAWESFSVVLDQLLGHERIRASTVDILLRGDRKRGFLKKLKEPDQIHNWKFWSIRNYILLIQRIASGVELNALEDCRPIFLTIPEEPQNRKSGMAIICANKKQEMEIQIRIDKLLYSHGEARPWEFPRRDLGSTRFLRTIKKDSDSKFRTESFSGTYAEEWGDRDIELVMADKSHHREFFSRFGFDQLIIEIFSKCQSYTLNPICWEQMTANKASQLAELIETRSCPLTLGFDEEKDGDFLAQAETLGFSLKNYSPDLRRRNRS